MTGKIGSQAVSRRGFLKYGGTFVAAAFTSAYFPLLAAAQEGPALALGRVVNGALGIFEQASFRSRQVAQLWQDMVVPIAEQIQGEADERFGPEWCRVGGMGYAHASGLQPVEIKYQQPVDEVRFTGSLAQVTVPFVDVYDTFSTESVRLYRYYFGSTHWVTKVVQDRDGTAWYRIFDDKFPERERWAPANRLRLIPDEELAPLSPEVPAGDKRIEVILEEQRMAAYEADQLVFETSISTGDYVTNPKYETPTGDYLIGLKRASQHMMPWDRTFGSYDLPGVPWVCYYGQRSYAFHGAYWHNGFGRIRSHGCVNLSPEDARWVYLWTTPVVQPYNQVQYLENSGTRVRII
jgi:lipoprotein-anchoring transpeptidase ErfK/SrfK